MRVNCRINYENRNFRKRVNMGTRADFYVGAGEKAEWLGSIAWDGYVDNESLHPILLSRSEEKYREEVGKLSERNDFSSPENGWPWPWEDSGTTDFSYFFVRGQVVFCVFGEGYFDAQHEIENDYPGMDEAEVQPNQPMPDMTSKKNVQLGGPKSGLITFGG